MKSIALLGMAAILLTAGLPARAAEPPAKMETVAVVSLAGYDELYRDIEYLGRASGNPDLALAAEGLISFFTQWQGLAGLDKTRPLGAAVRTDGIQFQILGFVPVKSVKQLFSALSGVVGVPEKMGDHGWRINTRAGAIFVKEQAGWAFVAQLEDNLNDLPADPAALLENLDKQYDLAVRLNMQAVPAPLRDMLLDQFKQKLAARAGVSLAPRSLTDQLLFGNADQAAESLSQLDQLTLGWSLDGPGRRTFLDVSITGVAGSKLAARAAAPPPPPSKLSGFMLGDATLSVHLLRRLPADAIERDLAILNSLKHALTREIDQGGILDAAEEKAKVTAWVEQTAVALSATIRKGVANGGLVAFDSAPKTRAVDDPFAAPAAPPVTVAGAFVLEQTDTLEQVFRQASKLAQAADRAPQVRLDVDKLGEVRFHRISMPTDDLIELAGINDDVVADLIERSLGDEAQLTVGFGPQRVFVALGPEGLATLKKVIERSMGSNVTGSNATGSNSSGSNSSGSNKAADDARLQVRLALGPLAQWWIDDDTNPMWAQVADEVSKSGKDHVTFTVRPIARGLRLRLEGEEGIVKTLGVALKFMAIGGRPAGR